MNLEIIVAMSDNYAIGKDNKLLWHIPEDLQNFKRLTTGHTVLMGRKTWESLPDKVRPLPNRKNVVLTTQKDYTAPGAIVINSTKDIPKEGKVFIIGGGEIYSKLIKKVHTIHLTIVHDHYRDADTYFPPIKFSDWSITALEAHHEKSFTFLTLIKNVK